MSHPLISIIVPVYKVEAYLDRCVESIVSQTYENLQIILVDDGSPDSCGALCDAWAEKDSRVIVIHQENSGVTAARLRGIEAATGDYLGFVDSDDVIEPEMYEQLLENAITHNAEISHCGHQVIRPDRPPQLFHGTGALEVMDHLTGLKELLSGIKIEPGLCNKLYRRELFHGLHQHIDPNIRIYEDLLINYFLFTKATTTVYHDICPYHYILRGDSASCSPLNYHSLYDPLTVLLTINQQAPEELRNLTRQRYIAMCMDQYSRILTTRSREYAKDKKTLRRFLRKEWKNISVLNRRDLVKYACIAFFFWVYEPIYHLVKNRPA